jgi:hypothetical protein
MEGGGVGWLVLLVGFIGFIGFVELVELVGLAYKMVGRLSTN